MQKGVYTMQELRGADVVTQPRGSTSRAGTDLMGIMWPASQSHFHLLFIFIEINFYSFSFLCDVCN